MLGVHYACTNPARIWSHRFGCQLGFSLLDRIRIVFGLNANVSGQRRIADCAVNFDLGFQRAFHFSVSPEIIIQLIMESSK